MGKFKPLSIIGMILLGAVTIVVCSIIMGRNQLEAQSPQIQIEYLPDGGVRFHLIEPKSVYETGWKPEDWFEGEKTLALCHAIIKQDVEEMQRLIDEGADVNARGKEDMPLLLWAYHSGEPTMECLLKNGADPNFLLTSNYAAPKGILLRGSTLLLLAVRGSSVPKYENYVNLLLKYGANPNLGKPSPLAYAASGLDTEKAFQSLIKAGADPNYNAGDARYLVNAANWFNAHRVNALLERGATYDINTLQGAQLQRYLYRLKTNPNFGVSTPETEKAIKWLEAHGVSFDEPAPLLPEEIEREEKRKKEAEALRRVAEKEAAYQSKLEYASK
ncbi:MAG: hypothetical protein J6X44_01180, partial [Thermoguttaceae bacterium]|nr:hypothetical protein [Thermoguttaceae bacterium]